MKPNITMRLCMIYITGVSLQSWAVSGRSDVELVRRYCMGGRNGALAKFGASSRPSSCPSSRQCVVACARLPEIKALLHTIAYAEGTMRAPGQPLHEQYATGVFGNDMSHFADHPRTKFCAQRQGKELCSTAAGRYQLLGKTWDPIARALGLVSFGPTEQDYAAIFLIVHQRVNITDILAGNIEKVLYRLHAIWPSLPTKGPDLQGQVRTTIPELTDVYQRYLREIS